MLSLLSQNPILFVFLIAALLLAVTFHEFMHAFTANYFGDPTAKHMGRVSLNPLHHLDTLGTLAILLIGIGWGKPVQINERNFKNPRLDSALVSLAGPLTNLVLAIVFSVPVLLHLVDINSLIYIFLYVIVQINVLLLIFNLIPIPPLDGSKVLYWFLPRSVDIMKLEMYGPMVLLALIFLSFISPNSGLFGIIFGLTRPIVNLLGFPVALF